MAVSLFHGKLSLICHINSIIYLMPHWLTFWKFIFNFSITSKKHSFPMFDLNVFDGFHRIICRFLSHRKPKTTEFGDQQDSKMSVRTKYFFIIRCTWTTNLEAWASQQEYLGVRNPHNFYSGDQLWGLGTLAKMLRSLKGSLKFSLEHSLVEGPLLAAHIPTTCLSSLQHSRGRSPTER